MLLMFVLWRALDFVFAQIATITIPYSGQFSHPSTLLKYSFPQWIKGFAQFDGIFYLRIAQNGYSQFEHAFFPLYPLLINLLSPIFLGNHLLAALTVSNLAFLTGLMVFKKYLHLVLPAKDRKNIAFIILFLLFFPTSFFFGSAYTEGLFFLLTISSLYFLHKKNYWLVALFAFLAASTRFIGLFLFIPILVLQYRTRTKLLAAAAPFLGIGTYIYYLWSTTGDAFAFFSSQSAFGAGRSTHLILFPQVIYRYLKILVTAQWNFVYLVSLLEITTFLVVFTVLVIQLRDLWRSKNKTLLGLNLFSLANILVPTFTGTFLSIPRFSLLSLSFFIYLGLMKNTYFKAILCLIFLLLHVALLALFIQGYFVS